MVGALALQVDALCALPVPAVPAVLPNIACYNLNATQYMYHSCRLLTGRQYVRALQNFTDVRCHCAIADHASGLLSAYLLAEWANY